MKDYSIRLTMFLAIKCVKDTSFLAVELNNDAHKNIKSHHLGIC